MTPVLGRLGEGRGAEATPPRPRLVALLTVHDRKALTLACLERLTGQAQGCGADVSVVLVDDGSTDGTGAAVREAFPAVQVVEGSGQLYWNGGMRLAFEVAREQDPDLYLLLNDDTHLAPGALARLLATHRALAAARPRPCLVVGSTLDPASGRQSYGGWRKGPRLAPGRFTLLEPGAAPRPCDTMNANCVLVPRAVVARVGTLDAAFTHSMGDLDYGLRAGRAGCELWVAPGFVGECQANTGHAQWARAAMGARERWRRVSGPKGLPPAEWLVFTSRHAGPLWPAWFAWPYLKTGWQALRSALAR